MVEEIFCQVLLFFLVAIFPFFLPQLTFASAPHPSELQSKQEALLYCFEYVPTFRAIISAVIELISVSVLNLLSSLDSFNSVLSFLISLALKYNIRLLQSVYTRTIVLPLSLIS